MHFEEMKKKVMDLNLPKGSYALFGSAPLAAHGIRESRDIDIIVIPELYGKLKAEAGWREEAAGNGGKKLVGSSVEVFASWNFGKYNPDMHELIGDANVIDGIPFVRLDEVLEWKKASGREKDLRDVRLIEAFMQAN